MLQALRDRLLHSARGIGEVLASPLLRRVQLAWGLIITGESAFLVGIAVFAYRAAGPVGVAILGLVRMLPAALVAPFSTILADRYRRERVLLVVAVARALALFAAAMLLVRGAGYAPVLALAGVEALVGTTYRPAQAALLPSLAHTPTQLVASNIALTTMEGFATLLGPAAGGFLLGFVDVDVVVYAAAGMLFLASVPLIRIRPDESERYSSGAHRGVVQLTAAGVESILRDRRVRLLVGLFGAQTVVRGALNVLTVVAALVLLGMGQSGVGYLAAAVGAGGLIGALPALGLVGTRRLGVPFVVGLALWGVPIALIAAWPHPAFALALLVLVGVGNALVDVSGLTLMQRVVPERHLARVFGILESVVLACIALGSAITPALISGFGIRGALVATGIFLPAVVLLGWRGLRAIDEEGRRAPRHLALLAPNPIFAPLPPMAMERLAARLVPLQVPAGTTVIAQGDPGDRFYIVQEGELRVTADGNVLRTVGPGDSFGEVALVRKVPRTATVTAITDARLLTLGQHDFLSAVTGHPQSAEAAEAVVSARFSPPL